MHDAHLSLSLSLRGENFPRHWPSLHFLFHLPYPTRYKRYPSTRRGWRNYYFVKRFASRLNFQFDSINTRFEFAIFEIYILQLLHTKARESTKIVPEFTIVPRLHHPQQWWYRDTISTTESLSYSHGGAQCRDSTAFCRITFPELHRFSASQPVVALWKSTKQGWIKGRRKTIRCVFSSYVRRDTKKRRREDARALPFEGGERDSRNS